MDNVDPQLFEFAMSKIKVGEIFEQFGLDFLCQRLGHEFTPIGGVKDKGIDGLEYCVTHGGKQKTIYQLSIETDPKIKIGKTIAALRKNSITFDRLIYVTNQLVANAERIIEDTYENDGVNLQIRPLAWLRGNINYSSGTIRVFESFVESYLHDIGKPGNSNLLIDTMLSDFESDPRLFIFLRQQWQEFGNTENLSDLVADSLIIYALEGTDPNTGIFMDINEIYEQIKVLVDFPLKIIQIDTRLQILSKKPRKIKYHRGVDKYCLPYETRLQLEKMNEEDNRLYISFMQSAEVRLKKCLGEEGIRVKESLKLLKAIFNQLFKQQGIEFADFVLKAENSNAFEKSLPDLISSVIDDSSVIPTNRARVKTALIQTTRDIIYHGEAYEKEYLRRLSSSYMVLFLLQCDPKIADFFSTMASHLRIFVCTSLLVPALSEFRLEEQHRRHWNLLLNAHHAGVQLYITNHIVNELAGHIRKSIQSFKDNYEGAEEIYTDNIMISSIDEILIRAYFYERINGIELNFYEFIDNIVTPSHEQHYMVTELIKFLNKTFGIKYIEDSSMGVNIDLEDFSTLTTELEHFKHSPKQAKNDANTILTIYALREKDNEKGDDGIFGYKTWWLSKDTTTQRAVTNIFGTKYPTSCYMRPDFLYNYISLAPSRDEANRVFDTMFPTLMGVTLSHHIPPEVTKKIHAAIKEHGTKSKARVHAILTTTIEMLQTDLSTSKRNDIVHYVDEQLKKMAIELSA